MLRSLSSRLICTASLGASLLCAGCASRKSQTNDASQANRKVEIPEYEQAKHSPQLYTDFGYVQMRTKNYPHAEHYFGEALKLDRKYAPAYVGMSRSLLAQKRDDQAEKTLNDGLKLCGRSGPIYNELAIHRAHRGDFEGAVAFGKKAVEAESTNSMYVGNLAGFLGMTGHQEESYQLYCRIGTPADARFRLAGILHSQGKPAAAQQQLQIALQSEPKHAASLAMLTKVTLPDVQTGMSPAVLPVKYTEVVEGPDAGVQR